MWAMQYSASVENKCAACNVGCIVHAQNKNIKMRCNWRLISTTCCSNYESEQPASAHEAQHALQTWASFLQQLLIPH